MNRLPIDDVLPALRQALAERHEAVLEAQQAGIEAAKPGEIGRAHV